MAFKNRIRLPIKITRPQYPEERSTFRNANGATKTMSVVVRKTLEGETDWMPEQWHEKLKIALAHDEVNIEGDKYNTNVSQDGDYEIEWTDFLDYPTAKAKFKVQVTPFSATNNNCMTCEEATQLNLVDDTIYANVYEDSLQEGEEYTIDVKDNDRICCYPATFSITSFNSTYLDSAEIDQNGILTIVVKSELAAANNILLVTYRVACPNGSYDEADVYGTIEGTIEGCASPTNVVLSALTPTTAAVSWDEANPVPNSYEWQLFEMQTPGTPVDSGTSAIGGVFPSLTGLDDGTDFGFYVRSVCDSGNSAWVEILFTTPVFGDTCGRYRVRYDDSTGISTNYADITYIDCNGEYQTVTVFNGRSRVICALQNSLGNPVDIINATEIEYEGLC